MAYHFDHDTLEIDHDAIRIDAEHGALVDAQRYWNLTYEQAFAERQARYLDAAQGRIASLLFIRARDAEVAAMSARERRIHALLEAVQTAPMIDDTVRAISEREAAERELAALATESI